MFRTQIYLTKKEREGLEIVSRATGKKQSELIRDAVDQMIDMAQGPRRQSILSAAAGLWRDREDLPDFAAARRSWDRGSTR
jgi:hypothetical protein